MQLLKKNYYMRGVIIILFGLSVGYGVYMQNKYDKALESLLICSTTSFYGYIDERLKDMVDSNGIRDTLSNNALDTQTQHTFTQEVNSNVYGDLTKKAEQNNINQKELEESLRYSGFNEIVRVRKSKQREGGSND